jgi:hypothetical protein
MKEVIKKYRIIVNINRVTTPYKEDFKKARMYHRKHGVDIDFVFKKVNVQGYQSSLFTHPNGFKQYILKGVENFIRIDRAMDATMFVFDMNEWSAPTGSEYPLKPETPNGSCMLTNGRPLICIGTYQVDHESGETWIQIAHEIMHSYVQNAYLKGINIKDIMDTYRENNNPDSPTGNFIEQWRLLAPYFD